MDAIIQTVIGQVGAGQVIKHLIPWDGVNKFIPLFNAIAGTAYIKSTGADWATSVIGGVMGQATAAQGKYHAKKALGEKKFKGLGMEGKRITLVDRSF